MQGSVTDAKQEKHIEIITRDHLVDDFRRLGVESGYIYNVKASLKTIGYVEGGAMTVVDALVEAVSPEGTIVTDSFVEPFPLPLNKNHAKIISNKDTPSYAGAIANAMLKHPNAFCSTHPIQRFVAIGYHAKELMNRHKPESYAYGVLQEMVESGQGRNLKIGTDEKVVGVGTTHVAIGQMGFKQKRPRFGINYYNEQEEILTFERDWAGGCGVGFNHFIPLYRKHGCIISEGHIGQAPSKITDMAKTLRLELEILKENPKFFLCDNPACADCRIGWEFSDGSRTAVFYHKAVRKLKRFLKPE